MYLAEKDNATRASLGLPSWTEAYVKGRSEFAIYAPGQGERGWGIRWYDGPYNAAMVYGFEDGEQPVLEWGLSVCEQLPPAVAAAIYEAIHSNSAVTVPEEEK